MRISILVSALSLVAACRSPQVSPDGEARSREAAIVQTLGGFDRPESCAFGLEGDVLFVGHCASDLFGPDRKKVGFVRGRGVVSKLAVHADGRVEMRVPRLASGLDGPLGLAVLPRATERYPRGTLLVAQGLALLVDDQGESVEDARELGTAIVFLDPDSGRRLGELPLGVDSELARRIGHPVLMPNSLAFDRAGNLYVTDSGRGGDRLTPAVAPNPGLIRIPHDALDAPSRGGFAFTPIPGIPNGVAYWPADDALCVVTMGGKVSGGEDVYYFPVADFPFASAPPPLASGVGTMDGVAVTPAGTLVVSRFSGDLLAIPRSGEPFPIRLEPDVALVAPADHRLLVLPDGSALLAVPEQARTELPAGQQRVRLVRLPPGF